MQKKNAVILLSGGLDSATVAAIAMHEGFSLSALTFNYNQNHAIELQWAKKLVTFFNINQHIIIDIPSEIFRTALVKNSDLEIAKSASIDQISDDKIPDTYVPARNILFLSYALGLAESINAFDIFIGANAVDYSGYPDCRPEFFDAFSNMANIGTKAGISGDTFTIHTPLITLKKSEIIKTGVSLGVDYSLTHSCYDPDEQGISCGLCDSCLFRKHGFDEAGIKDPTLYRKV